MKRITTLVIIALSMMLSARAQTPLSACNTSQCRAIKAAEANHPGTAEERPALPPAQPVSKLPTPEEAAYKLVRMNAVNGDPTSENSFMIAYLAARRHEIEAIKAGNADRVDTKEVTLINSETSAETDARDHRVLSLFLYSKCGGEVVIGMTEACVISILGKPLHTNSDLTGSKQMVYDRDVYVYIDSNGRVENMQTTE